METLVKKTSVAFLILHGIGQQNPYQTLDQFVRPVWDLLNKESAGSGQMKGHHCARRGESETEHYVSLELSDNHTTLDFYEYYWAHQTQGKAKFSDIYQWLLKTSRGAGKYYSANVQIMKTYESENADLGAFDRNGFRKHWYLKHLGWLVYALSFIQFIKWTTFGPLVNWILRKIGNVVADYIGDIVLYTTTDVKSPHYRVRQTILDGAVEKIVRILRQTDYDKVIIAGHSLGSVIAYDALNRLSHRMPFDEDLRARAARIIGLVTFGSPLDKVAFFFREHPNEKDDILRQIISQNHNYKIKPLDSMAVRHPLSHPFQGHLEHIRWINFWSPKDPVSGHLDFYTVDVNVRLELNEAWGKAHTGYWAHAPMYTTILNYFYVRADKQ